jgi:hypothetical protein
VTMDMTNRDPILVIIRQGIQTILKYVKLVCKLDVAVRLTGLLHNVKLDNEKLY